MTRGVTKSEDISASEAERGGSVGRTSSELACVVLEESILEGTMGSEELVASVASVSEE